MDSSNLLGDDPVDASGDELDRNRFSDHIVRVINRVRMQSESSVIALVGRWGAGKSSLLEMIKESIDDAEYKQDVEAREWRIADFNPWVHSDPISMYVGFYSELRACLPGRKRWSQTRESIGSWMQTAAPLGKLGGIARIDASSILDKMAEKISGDTSAAAKKEKAEEALRECGVSILVVMDDLDRVTPEELLEVFKMIRLVGRLPNVYYLLSYDEKTLIDVLCRTDLALNDRGRAGEYLEKMIQVRLDIPALTDGQTTKLLTAALETVLSNNAVSLSEAALGSIASMWDKTLSTRLLTPRSIRRFFAQVDVSYGTVAQEVNFEDFLAMTFLRTYEHRVYSEIAKHGGELTMSSTIAGRSLRSEDHRERAARWEGYLRDWDVAEHNVRGVMNLLGKLFLPIRSAVEGMEYGADWLGEISRKKGVGHADYFTRYFFFGVPDGDISDFTIERALTNLSENDASTREVQLLSEFLNRDPERIVRKIHNFGDLNETATAHLLDIMAHSFLAIPDNVSFFASLSRVSIEGLAEDLFTQADESALSRYLHAAAQSNGGYCMAVRGLWRARARAVRSDQSDAAEKYTEILLDFLHRKFEEIGKMDISEVSQDVFATIHQWSALSSESVRFFLHGRVESGAWPLMGIIDRLVNRGTTSTQKGKVLMGLEDQVIEQTVGLDYAFERLGSEIDEASTDVLMEGLPDTPDNRRAVGLAALSFARHRRLQNGNDPDQS
ncbi:P-loop NTPase fold protein [Streptomyces aquilus]|uniref:KAP family P-loop NTPase fold protein n=1 Tax=Streptomyces aquilus TaxID=2548456 RepID=UPI0037CEE006